MQRHPLAWFFGLAYGVTWLLWSPMLLLHLPPFVAATHTPNWAVLPGIAIGVTGSAFLVTALTQGRAGVQRLLQRLVAWRVDLRWYAVAVLLLPLSALAVAGRSAAPTYSRPSHRRRWLATPTAYLAHFVFGPLWEETGWRGFALPRLQHRHGPLRGTLLLGLLWSGWHFFLYLPVWFQAGNPLDGLISTAIFVVTTTAMAFVFTWLFNNTGASLLLSILLHGSVDGTATDLQRLADQGLLSAEAAANSVGLGLTIACVLLALLLVLVTRGTLSVRRYRREAERLDLRPDGVR